MDIPAQLSVVSCDDPPAADYLQPSLTAIKTPFAAVGAAAVDALLDQLAGGAPRRRRGDETADPPSWLDGAAANVIVLRSAELLIRADPAHGGEILDLVHLATGRRFSRPSAVRLRAPGAGDLEEPVWTASYRGGWQLVTPVRGTCARSAGPATASTAAPAILGPSTGSRSARRLSRGRGTAFVSSAGSSSWTVRSTCPPRSPRPASAYRSSPSSTCRWGSSCWSPR